MRTRTAALVLGIVAAGALFYIYGRSLWGPVYHKLSGRHTVAEAVALYAPAVDKRLAPAFETAGISYPTQALTLIGLKEEKILELWAEQDGGRILIKRYEVKAASGTSGPKLKEGDRQVPEGFYRVEGLNPNSSYHLSLKLNYPNEFDQQQAHLEGRDHLGGDIFIHGKSASIGCLAIGDEAIEEVLVLASRVGVKNIAVLIAPQDFRKRAPVDDPAQPPWVGQLYVKLAKDLSRYTP